MPQLWKTKASRRMGGTGEAGEKMRCCNSEFKFLCEENETGLPEFERCEKRDLLLYEKYRLKVREKKKTNADCIRAMSDEELADQLVIRIDGLEECSLYLSAPTGKLFISRSEAVRVTLEWLGQPAEEE